MDIRTTKEATVIKCIDCQNKVDRIGDRCKTCKLSISKKGEMNYTSFGIMLILISVLTIGFSTLFIGTLNLYPNANLDANASQTYVQIVQVANLTDQIGQNVGNASPTSDTFDVQIYKKGFASIELVFFTGLSMVNNLITDFSSALGIPAWVGGAVLSIIVLILALFAVTIFIRSFIKL